MPLGIHDYGWYLWHYLYNNYLQQVWALFAILFAFGGLIRERSTGAVQFSLSLPIRRRRWLFTRLAVALLESIALSLFAVLVVVIGSAVIHQTFSLSEVLLHTALMVAAGVFMIAFGNLCYTLFPGNYLSLLLTLVLLGAPYLLLQTYMQHMRYVGRTTWILPTRWPGRGNCIGRPYRGRPCW
jgi:ABC-type transport system involved in multi-copper enzyme maturation permease subunit